MASNVDDNPNYSAAENLQSEETKVPDHLRPLFEEWFGEDSAPLLFRSVNLESWDICRHLLNDRNSEINMEELKHIDVYGYCSLHYACWWRTPPVDIVRKLIEWSPSEYAMLQNRKGRTPLHFAAWRGRDECVEWLAEKCPKAASVKDRTQKTALVDACHGNRSKRVLEALVKADESQILHAHVADRSPPMIFFRISHGYISASSQQRSPLVNPDRSAAAGPKSFSDDPPAQANYAEKVRVILAAERRQLQQIELKLEDDWDLLRATIESPSCPFAYVKHLLDKVSQNGPCQNDNRETGADDPGHCSRKERSLSSFRDQHGNTVLHWALKAPKFHGESFYRCNQCNKTVPPGQKMQFNRDPDKAHWGARCFENCETWYGDRNRHRLSNVRHFHFKAVTVVCKEAAIVEYLLSRHQELAQIPEGSHHHRLPLHLALIHGRTWYTGVQRILRCHPTSLIRRDLRVVNDSSQLQQPFENTGNSGLYPFQLAGVKQLRPGVIDNGDEQKIPARPKKRPRIERLSKSTQEDCDRLTTIFRLLSENPTLVPDF